MSFFAEIRRRKVFQVAAVYAVVAWLLIQVITAVEEPLRLPEWADSLVIVLLAIGFPITVIVSWAFDVTPEGIVRDRGTSAAAARRGRGLELLLGVLLISAVGWIAYREITSSASDASDILPNSVAVLPCANLSPDPDNSYFAAGIHEELLNQLVKIRDLNVIARTSVLQYEDVARPITEIASELNVRSIMECSVRYADDRVVVAAQLIDAATGVHLWSEGYERELIDAFGIQADIAEQVAGALQVELLPTDQQTLERSPTDSPEALELYLRSVALPLPVSNPNTLPTHLALLNRAIELDEDFALAYLKRAWTMYGDTTRVRWDEITSDIDKALELDPTLATAHTLRAVHHRDYKRWAEALEEFDIASKLGPNDGINLFFYSRSLMLLGRDEEALQLARHAASVDPIASSNLLAYQLARVGDLDEAAEKYAEVLLRDPVDAPSLSVVALVEVARGNEERALEFLLQAEEIWMPAPDWGSARMAYTNARLGRPERAAWHIEQLQVAQAQEGVIETGHAIEIALALRDVEQAMRLMRDYVENPPVDLTNVNPQLLDAIRRNWWNDPILGRPEFVEVRRRMNFGN